MVSFRSAQLSTINSGHTPVISLNKSGHPEVVFRQSNDIFNIGLMIAFVKIIVFGRIDRIF